MTFRSRTLLASAYGKHCCSCGSHDGTTVPAHVNSVALGKGRGIKAPDYFHARMCQRCHDLYDGRRPGWSPEERIERFFLAYCRTMACWHAEGLVEFK